MYNSLRLYTLLNLSIGVFLSIKITFISKKACPIHWGNSFPVVKEWGTSLHRVLSADCPGNSQWCEHSETTLFTRQQQPEIVLGFPQNSNNLNFPKRSQRSWKDGSGSQSQIPHTRAWRKAAVPKKKCITYFQAILSSRFPLSRAHRSTHTTWNVTLTSPFWDANS